MPTDVLPQFGCNRKKPTKEKIYHREQVCGLTSFLVILFFSADAEDRALLGSNLSAGSAQRPQAGAELSSALACLDCGIGVKAKNPGQEGD